jgi:hypothetical protein
MSNYDEQSERIQSVFNLEEIPEVSEKHHNSSCSLSVEVAVVVNCPVFDLTFDRIPA